MEEGRKFIITENDRKEVLHAIISRNFSQARGILNQLPEIKEDPGIRDIDNSKFEKQEVKNNGRKTKKTGQ